MHDNLQEIFETRDELMDIPRSAVNTMLGRAGITQDDIMTTVGVIGAGDYQHTGTIHSRKVDFSYMSRYEGYETNRLIQLKYTDDDDIDYVPTSAWTGDHTITTIVADTDKYGFITLNQNHREGMAGEKSIEISVVPHDENGKLTSGDSIRIQYSEIYNTDGGIDLINDNIGPSPIPIPLIYDTGDFDAADVETIIGIENVTDQLIELVSEDSKFNYTEIKELEYNDDDEYGRINGCDCTVPRLLKKLIKDERAEEVKEDKNNDDK